MGPNALPDVTVIERLEYMPTDIEALVELAKAVAQMDLLDIIDYLRSQRKRKWGEQVAQVADLWEHCLGGDLGD